jgi:tetratricopeptide (TPR) repeat protein
LFTLQLALSAQAQTPNEAPVGYPPCATVPDEATTQAAQGAFQAGNASFNEADYTRAIVYWEDAYRRDCTAHAMLKNLARAYELNGQFAHAIVALETFIQRAPDSGETEALQRRIENLQQKQRERAEAEAAAARAKARAERQRAQAAAKPKEPADEEMEGAQDEPSGAGRSVLPLVLTGVGVAVAGTGAVLWYGAHQDVQDVESQCGGRQCPSELSKKGNDAIDRQIRWAVVAGAGGALALGGLIWYFAQPSDDAAETTFTPVLAPGLAAFSVQSAF